MQQGADCSTSSECLSTPSALPKIGWELYSGSIVAYTKSFAPGRATNSTRDQFVPKVFRITSQAMSAAVSFAHKLSRGARLSSAMAMM